MTTENTNLLFSWENVAYSDKNEQLFQIVNFDEKYTDSDNLNSDSDNLNSDSNQNER